MISSISNSVITSYSIHYTKLYDIVFVNGSYPGDRVNVKIKKIKNSYSEAKLLNVIKPSKFRVQPRCKYFGTCGGCKQQDLDYKMQLSYKQQQVKDAFEHIGKLTEFEIEDIIPSENVFFYRNKMEFSFSDKRWLTFVITSYSIHYTKLYDDVTLKSTLKTITANFTAPPAVNLKLFSPSTFIF